MKKARLVLLIAVMILVSGSLIAWASQGSARSDISITSPILENSSDRGIVLKGVADSRAVVWDNGMQYENLLTAQDDPVEGMDSEPADDFIFDVDQLVNDVHWIGGYWAGPPDDGDFDWRVTFYTDFGDGTKPGAVIATWVFPNASVNETLVEPIAGGGYYSYAVDLPTTLSFLGGTKYWISIQGVGLIPPQSGWAMHSDIILLHEAVFRSVYFGYPDWTDLSVALGYPVDMCFQLTYEERCDWQPGDPYKMHYPQLPDETGWDVNATAPLILADDWLCTESGWVKDIHFWGSWRNDIEGEILAFSLSIHSDIPADPPQIPYSMPGELLWYAEWIEDFDMQGIDPPSMEGWYDPATGEVIPNDHQHYFQYNICLDSIYPGWFYQEAGTIYWLDITAHLLDPQGTQWGWKSTQDHWNDDAVYGGPPWIDLWEPYVPDPIYNMFYIFVDQSGMVVDGGGTDFYGDGWYYYEMEEWWNIWYYDHPFDSTRYKMGTIEFDVHPFDVGPSYFEIAVNWSTDIWSLEQPPGDSMPPLPPTDELLYIGRQTLFWTEQPEGHYIFEYVIPDYNPEWVSVDVRGFNFVIPEGIIMHECIGQQSLDLSFVITSDTIVCDCEPGNADGIGIIEISDAVYLVNFVFIPGSPAPTPYPICSGDADCNCIVEISDAVYLINYIFTPGAPPPCDCLTWLSICGPPLR